MDSRSIACFDEALDLYMSAVFGGDNRWRGACHQSAKIAAAALQELLPDMPVRAVLVELTAYMDDGKSLVHIGWKDDDRQIEGEFPMHWAVQIGDDLYDPGFWQLRKSTTRLALPNTAYFYAHNWFPYAKSGRGTDADGMTWVHDGAKPGLNVGYLVREEGLPGHITALLMDDGEARIHARMVRVAYGEKDPV
jgi:hypothetical protein